MKVICVDNKYYSECELLTHPNITIGKIYDVITMDFVDTNSYLLSQDDSRNSKMNIPKYILYDKYLFKTIEEHRNIQIIKLLNE